MNPFIPIALALGLLLIVYAFTGNSFKDIIGAVIPKGEGKKAAK